MIALRTTIRSLRLAAAVLVLTLSTGLSAQEKLPPGAKVVKLEAFPAMIDLKHQFDYTQLLITAQLANGDRLDATRIATVQAPPVVKVSPLGQVRPMADGDGQLVLKVGDQSVAVPVKVAGQKAKYEVSFVRDVMPIIGKLGCNAGTCHGAQAGRNGFKLSLRGYDPLFDHRALVDDLAGRRFNRASPDHSLMLLKTSGSIPHTGGILTRPGEPYYDMLRLWVAEGVRFDGSVSRVRSVEVYPRGPVIPLPGMKQQTAVLATFADGSVRDVTAEAILDSSNTEVATVDKAGLVTSVRRGEVSMMARYEGAYAATTLIVMGDRSGFAWQPVPENNWIDGLVYEKLKQVKMQPSGLCSDSDFIRRIYLDLTGLPPTADEVRKFLADTRPTRVKRDELIDKLIGSPDFVEHWTNKWADLLQVNRKFLGDQGAKVLRDYIRKAVADNMPYDQFVRSILTASGSNIDNPAAGYFKVLRTAPDTMENTTHLFLGIRFNCNKCHDHPFERWTQDQYYQLSAYFMQVGRNEDPKFKGQKIGGTDVEGAKPLVEIISDTGSGDIKHERTGAITPPKFPYAHKDMPDAKGTRRQQLAHWLASKENQYFARSYANRVWSYLTGAGVIEPVDDIRAGNPASNPKLLDRLTEEFVKSNFNMREMIRTICKSRTYQHSIETNKWNADDEINYSHGLARRLPAEVLYDAIHRSTGSVAQLPGLPPGSRAAQLVDSDVEALSGEFLKVFGKPPRESACECERAGGLMLGPILNLVNGPILANALKDPANRINQVASTEKDDTKLIEELYLSILCRRPTAEETSVASAMLGAPAVDHARLVTEYNQRKAALENYEKTLPDKIKAFEASFKSLPIWVPIEVAEAKAIGGAVLTKQPDGSLLASGPNPTPQKYTITALAKLQGITGIRLEALTDPKLPAQGPGRAPNGNFVLNEFVVKASKPDQAATELKKVDLHKPAADFSQDQYPIAYVLDSNVTTGWAIAPQIGKPHTAVFELKTPLNDPAGAKLLIEMDQQFTGGQHTIGKFRLSLTTHKGPLNLTGPPPELVPVLSVEPAQRTPQQQQVLANYYQGQDAELQRLRRELSELGALPTIRQLGAQDIAWALINSKEFLFNH